MQLTKAGQAELIRGLKAGEEDLLASAAGRKVLDGLYFPDDDPGTDDDFTSSSSDSDA